jgi:hypothetical protein
MSPAGELARYVTTNPKHVKALRVAINCAAFFLVACRDYAKRPDSPVVVAETPMSAQQIAASVIHWPTDPMTAQLGALVSFRDSVPSCGTAAAILPDSVGPFKPGETLLRVSVRCARAVPLWDLGDEGIAAPVLMVRIGSARFELLFSDTVATATLEEIVTADTLARTTKGIGPEVL